MRQKYFVQVLVEQNLYRFVLVDHCHLIQANFDNTISFYERRIVLHVWRSRTLQCHQISIHKVVYNGRAKDIDKNILKRGRKELNPSKIIIKLFKSKFIILERAKKKEKKKRG